MTAQFIDVAGPQSVFRAMLLDAGAQDDAHQISSSMAFDLLQISRGPLVATSRRTPRVRREHPCRLLRSGLFAAHHALVEIDHTLEASAMAATLHLAPPIPSPTAAMNVKIVPVSSMFSGGSDHARRHIVTIGR